MADSKRILYIVHDAQVYGSQQSLSLILDQICRSCRDSQSAVNEPFAIQPFVTLARNGPLTDKLAQYPGLTLLQHKRLQWFKHDKRRFFQHVGDIFNILVNMPSRVSVIYRHIKQNQIDLVHTNSVVSLEGAIAAKLAGIPHVWHVRELFMDENPKLFPTLGKRFTRWIVKTLSSRVICISKAVQAQFAPYLTQQPEKFPLLYNVLAPEQIPSIPAPASADEQNNGKRFKIGFAGRLSAGKRLHDLLESIALLKEALPESELPQINVVGNFVDSRYKYLIEHLIAKHRLEKQVELFGYQQNLSSFYKQMDVLVVPSKNEPFGRVIIEAMAYGTPCIGSDSGGIPEIIEDNQTGWLFPTGDYEALAQKIRHVMEHPDTLREVGQNAGRIVLERFTIEKQWPKLRALYQDALQ